MSKFKEYLEAKEAFKSPEYKIETQEWDNYFTEVRDNFQKLKKALESATNLRNIANSLGLENFTKCEISINKITKVSPVDGVRDLNTFKVEAKLYFNGTTKDIDYMKVFKDNGFKDCGILVMNRKPNSFLIWNKK